MDVLRQNLFQSAKTLELLPEMDQSDQVPPSITEQTSKHLGGKVRS